MAQLNKKRKRNALSAPVSVLLIFAAVVFGLSIFFRVSGVEVKGNSFYYPEEVVAASGIEEGDNLFFINRFSAISRIFSKLPYVENASVSRSLPNKVVITVTESKAIAYVDSDDGTWAIDRSCKLLSRIDGDDLEGLIQVIGLRAVMPEAGQPLQTSDGDAYGVSYLSEILTQIQGLDLREKVTEIHMVSETDVFFDFDGRFTVKLGSDAGTEYKFQCLLGALEKLSEGDRGTLDLSIDSSVHFTYD